MEDIKDIKDIKNIEYKLKREHYYSQIRDIDINRKREKCYVIEQKQLNTIKVNNIDFIIISFQLYTQDLKSFPDLHKYQSLHRKNLSLQTLSLKIPQTAKTVFAWKRRSVFPRPSPARN
jgi:hypothetical protein